MKSRLIASRRSPVKKATVLISKQTLEQAIQEGNLVVEEMMEKNPHDPALDQIEETVTFLSSILTKDPSQMQAEGASTIEDYLDDAIMPEMAQKIKQGVDMIAEKKNALRTQAPTPAEAPVMASGSDNWVNDRDEKGEPKAPEKVEVPRLAADKKAAPAAAPAPAAPAPAPAAKPEADITQLSSDTLAKMQKALAGAEDLMNDKAAQAFIAAIAEELMNRPVEAEPPPAPAAPAVVAPAKAAKLGGLKVADAEETAVRHDDVPVAPTPNVFQGGDDTKAEDTKTATAKEAVAPEGWEGTVKEMKKHKDIDNPWALSWYMKDKGYKSHEGSLETWKMAQASLKLELLGKYASAQGGSWFVSDQDTGNVIEGSLPEVAQAHAAQEFHTGIDMPKTDLPSKFAADMTTNKALKLSEKMSEQLKGMYLEAKQLGEVNDSRPVREAVEAIYRAYDMFGEASKVFSKQQMQEDAEAKAVEVKEQNKKKSSALFGLSVAAAEDEKKCKCGKPVYGKFGEYSRCKDCYEEQGSEAEKATGVQ